MRNVLTQRALSLEARSAFFGNWVWCLGFPRQNRRLWVYNPTHRCVPAGYAWCMDTRTFTLAEEAKRKVDTLQTDVRNQPVLARARDIIGANASLVVTGVALAGVVAACLVTRVLLGRR